MDKGAVVVAVTGVVVSGLLGPTATALMTRGSDSRRSHREIIAADRSELRDLLDEAAVLLGSGLRMLRLGRETNGWSTTDEWANEVARMGQRLQLRLLPTDPVVATYQRVVDQLMQIAAAGEAVEEADLGTFEHRIDGFLAASRQWLAASRPGVPS